MTSHGGAGTPPGWTREALQFVQRTSLMVLLLTLCYYMLPPGGRLHDGATAARWIGSLVALSGFVLLVLRSLRAARADRSFTTRAEAVLTVLYVMVLVFAITYGMIATHMPGEFHGIENPTDALYFTVTVAATVGFGDITAAGTAARLVVTVHMLVNLIYVGTALRVLTNRGTARGPGGEGPPARPTA